MTLQQLLSLVVPVFVWIGRRAQAHLSLCVPAALSADRWNVVVMPKEIIMLQASKHMIYEEITARAQPVLRSYASGLDPIWLHMSHGWIYIWKHLIQLSYKYVAILHLQAASSVKPQWGLEGNCWYRLIMGLPGEWCGSCALQSSLSPLVLLYHNQAVMDGIPFAWPGCGWTAIMTVCMGKGITAWVDGVLALLLLKGQAAAMRKIQGLYSQNKDSPTFTPHSSSHEFLLD